VKVHPPKAVDSWREFFIEIAIIVIGVALALAAEEMLSNYHTNKEVAVVEDSLNDELSDSLFASLETIRAADCNARVLDRVDGIVHGTGDLAVGDIPGSPVRLWGSAAWDAAVASGIVEEMEHDQRHAYAQLFSVVRALREWNTREREQWAIVKAYRQSRPATADARHRLAEAVSQLRSLNGIMTVASKQFVEIAKPLELKLTAADSAELREPARCPVE
jgi:hypothetical protein